MVPHWISAYTIFYFHVPLLKVLSPYHPPPHQFYHHPLPQPSQIPSIPTLLHPTPLFPTIQHPCIQKSLKQPQSQPVLPPLIPPIPPSLLPNPLFPIEQHPCTPMSTVLHQPSQVRPTPLLPTPVVHHTYAQRISAQAKKCPQSTVVDSPPIQRIN